jgi:hypothetical protein
VAVLKAIKSCHKYLSIGEAHAQSVAGAYATLLATFTLKPGLNVGEVLSLEEPLMATFAQYFVGLVPAVTCPCALTVTLS